MIAPRETGARGNRAPLVQAETQLHFKPTIGGRAHLGPLSSHAQDRSDPGIPMGRRPFSSYPPRSQEAYALRLNSVRVDRAHEIQVVRAATAPHWPRLSGARSPLPRARTSPRTGPGLDGWRS